MKRLICLSVFIFSVITHAALELENGKKAGELNFLAVGKPAMIKIKGTGPAPMAKAIIDNNKMSVDANLLLSELETGISLRDEHMKDKYLQVKEFPNARLKVELINLPEGFESKPTSIKDQPFQGKLTLHGKEQNISGVYSLSDSLELTANFNIKLTDFGIEIPNYLGVKVADTVAIDTKFILGKK